MPLLKSSAGELFLKASTGRLNEIHIEFYRDRYAVGVVMASGEYPYRSSSPAEIIIDEIVDSDLAENSHISFAGVTRGDDGKLYATGGRVLVCIGLGDTIEEARDRAYLLVGQVHFAGKQCKQILHIRH